MTEAVGGDPRAGYHHEERPWGGFDLYAVNEPCTVKVLTLRPGQRLSLQTHARRAEFWEVLDVALELTVGDRVFTAEPGQRVWIPVGTAHRIGNLGDRPGRVLEICYGPFEEGDVHRLHDDYAR